jgi:hypothetical protein
MKKESLFIVLLLIIFSIFNQFISAEITGQEIYANITGKVTQQEVGLSIFVSTVGGIPSIEITSPKNGTYLKNESILLNYTLDNGNFVWYNIDNSTNTTINSSVYFNVSQGQHTLYIYTNNSNGTASNQISFTANSTRFIILFEEYKGSNKGSSTNFLDYTYEEIQSLEDIILENTDYGKILFNDEINMTDDSNNTDNLLDLDSNTEISSNLIELDSTEIPNFDEPATVWLYNLSFTNPRILKNGAVCPANVCIKESYTGGTLKTLKFNVTGFTTYSAEETPSNPPGGGPGGGGTSGGEEDIQIIETNETIDISPEKIQVSLKQGQTISQEVYLTNNYNETKDIILDIYGVSQFVTIKENRFQLLRGQKKKVILNFSIPENITPDNYIGKLVVITPEAIYGAEIILDIQSKESIFDVSLNINEENFPLSPGENIYFTTNIYNLGDSKEINITLKYAIKDLNGNVILEEEVLDKINERLEKPGELQIPEGIIPGKYLLSVRVDYEGKTAVTSKEFIIEKRKGSTLLRILIPSLIILLIIILFWILGKREEKKAKRKYD